MPTTDHGSQRRALLSAARLYLVCSPTPYRRPVRDGELAELLRRAIAGGVQIVQLRDKHMPDAELTRIAADACAVCRPLGALLIVNDRPLVAVDAAADGVHVGQDDMPVADVRALVGPDMLIGLSTHARAEIDAAAGVDYIGVGPVHETPTKPGRPAVGLELVRYAAAHATLPFFAIGGIDAQNVGDVVGAGARRVCVLRAITQAEDPQQAARALRERLDVHAVEG